MLIFSSIRHLEKVQQGYLAHGFFAIKWGFFLITLGVGSILHGLVPALFPFAAPRNIMKLARMIEDRGNPEEMEALGLKSRAYQEEVEALEKINRAQ